jgi:hypothetical protein
VVDQVDQRGADEGAAQLRGPVGDHPAPGEVPFHGQRQGDRGVDVGAADVAGDILAEGDRKRPPPVISSQSPLAANICSPRPAWFSAATAMATTPSPKAISTSVPRNSASSSPPTVRRHRPALS